ncbi:MAG: methylmalonyl Co-A mutase-associated GTPase MeaB [Planctomycetota bacterium]|jgi:LAO/AO transport system kinase
MTEQKQQQKQKLEKLAAGVRKGNRKILAQAITLVESSRSEDSAAIQELLQAILPETGKAVRVGITGAPGVGKSTFIDELGTRLTEKGHRVAVLAVDPSSAVSGGSILGDKTRMLKLSTNTSAFVRPSPSGQTVGGVARRTREAMLLCEAAGHDVVMVETIGVGQTETAVANMVDCFVLMMLPGAGDELQGIKRGIMELADVVLIHKADGDNLQAAEAARQEFATALRILRGGGGNGEGDGDPWQPPVLCASSRTGDGISNVWKAVQDRVDYLGKKGLAERRRQQNLQWFEGALEEVMRQEFLGNERVAQALPELRQQVLEGKLQPMAAARKLLSL